MPDPVDGHYQFNGTNWSFYLTLQPGLKCYDADHVRCKEASALYVANRTAEQAVEQQRQLDAQREQVSKAAAEQAAKDQVDLLNAAGQRKNDATRAVGFQVQRRTDAAKAKAQQALVDAQAVYDQAVETAQDALAVELKAALDEQKASQDKVEAIDWLALVKSEQAGAAGPVGAP